MLQCQLWFLLGLYITMVRIIELNQYNFEIIIYLIINIYIYTYYLLVNLKITIESCYNYLNYNNIM